MKLVYWKWAIAGGVILAATGCTREQAPFATPYLTIQLAGEPASLDPTLAEDGASLKVLCNTMEGLVGYDGAGKLQNLAAESYRVSPDGRRYEFTLRAGARWSDGKPVTAADFVTAITRALTPGSGSKLAGIFFPIQGAREFFEGKTDARGLGVREEKGHLVIELKEAAPYFIQSLTMPTALPLRRDVLEANGGKWPETAPADGPYRIASHVNDRKIHFEKNPYYWTDTRSYPDVEMLIVEDEATALNLFEQNRLDILSKIGSLNLPRLRARPGVVHTDPFLATYYLSFNFRKPPFDDVVWRRAVSGAIHRERIVEVLDEGSSPARSWVPPSLEGFIPYADPAPVFASAVAEARRRGKPPGGALIAAYDTSTRNTTVMEAVQADLKSRLGLELSLSNLDWASYLKAVHTDPPQLFRLGILSPFLDPIQILEAFTTGNPNNYLKWSDARYDGLVHRIAALKPGPERAAAIRDAQRLLVDEQAIVVPIYHYVQNHAIGPRVGGFRVNPFGEIRFGELSVRAAGDPHASH